MSCLTEEGAELLPSTLRRSCGRETNVQPCRRLAVAKVEQSKGVREPVRCPDHTPPISFHNPAPHLGIR